MGIVLGQAVATGLAVQPLRIQLAALAIKPGDPMCERAMVTHPPAVRGGMGMVSWSPDGKRIALPPEAASRSTS